MKLILNILNCLLIFSLSSFAADISGNLALKTAYVSKGATYNDGFVIQPSITIKNYIPLSIKIWGNLDIDNFGGAVDSGQFSVTKYTLGKSFNGVRINYHETQYPNSNKEAKREIQFKLPIKPLSSFSILYGIDGGSQDTFYFEAIKNIKFKTTNIHMTIGGFENRRSIDNGLSHYNIGVTKTINQIYLNLTYTGQINSDVLPNASGKGTYEVDWIGSIGYDF